jgi:hypothetical protein
MTKKETVLVDQARKLTATAIDRANAAPLDQAGKNAISDPMTEALAILGGLLFKAPK